MLSVWIVAVLVQSSAATQCGTCTSITCNPETVPVGSSACPATSTLANKDTCCRACLDNQHGAGVGRNVICLNCHPECLRCNSRSECDVCAAGQFFGTYEKTARGTCDYTCVEGYRLKMTEIASGVASNEPVYSREDGTTHRCVECDHVGCAICIGITGPVTAGTVPGTEKCTQCKPDYVMSPGCPKCELKMQTAGTVPACTADCDDGFSKENNVCKACKTNCKTCDHTTGNCETTKDGFYISTHPIANTVKPCGLNVKTCTETLRTTTTNTGGWGNEVPADGCVADDDAATTGEPEYGQKTFTVGSVPGTTTNPTGNTMCDLSCDETTFYADAASNTCKQCYTRNGITCACNDGPAESQCLNTGTCPDKKYGYTGAAGELGTCESCTTGYKRCTGATSGTCDDGYVESSTGGCQACTAAGCKTCDTAADQCTLCADTKIISGAGTSARCEPCSVGHCKTCVDATKDTLCTDCEDGYAGELCDRRCSASLRECVSCTRGGHFCKLCSDNSDPRGVSHSCSHASMTGDPHVTNLRGEKFDVMQSGKHSLICLPRGHCGGMNDLHVQVTVARLSGGTCESAFVQDLTLDGKWVGEAITISAGTLRSQKTFGVHAEKFYSFKDLQKSSLTKHAGKTMTIVAVKSDRETIAANFGGVTVSVEHISHPHLSFLNVNAQGLLKQDVEVGGLLGLDGHKEAATAPNGCKHKVRAHRGGSDALASELIAN